MTVVNRPINRWTVGLMNLSPSDRVLEVGFGSGFAIHRVARTVTEGLVVGVDYSREMTRQALWRNVSAERSGRVLLTCGDASRLPLTDDAFDKACAIQTIYFWPDPVATLRELRRALRPGGLLAISVFPKRQMQWWRFLLRGYALYSADEIEEMMRAAGFRRISRRTRRGPLPAVCVLGVR